MSKRAKTKTKSKKSRWGRFEFYTGKVVQHPDGHEVDFCELVDDEGRYPALQVTIVFPSTDGSDDVMQKRDAIAVKIQDIINRELGDDT